MHRWLKISHHEHSGHHRPHEFTSYTPLVVLLVVVGVILTISSVSAANPGPEAGSVGLTGEMPGPPPTTAAVITAPTSGQGFSTSPVTIQGTCPASTLVEIYKNNIFAGSTPCDSTGHFSLSVDLLIGANALTARVYNALNEPGPNSNTVNVDYNALPPQGSALATLDLTGNQLLLNTNAVYRGTFPNQVLNVPINILGGTQPYAVNVQWGDSTNQVISRSNDLQFDASHTYTTAGTYQITIQATDSQGRVAYLTVAAIINGQPPAAAASSGTPKSLNKLLVLWPLYTSALAIVISFWLGERREKKIVDTTTIKPHFQI